MSDDHLDGLLIGEMDEDQQAHYYNEALNIREFWNAFSDHWKLYRKNHSHYPTFRQKMLQQFNTPTPQEPGFQIPSDDFHDNPVHPPSKPHAEDTAALELKRIKQEEEANRQRLAEEQRRAEEERQRLERQRQDRELQEKERVERERLERERIERERLERERVALAKEQQLRDEEEARQREAQLLEKKRKEEEAALREQRQREQEQEDLRRRQLAEEKEQQEIARRARELADQEQLKKQM